MEELTKEEIALSNAIQGIKFLVADPNSSRKSVRKLLSDFRIKPGMIDAVETFGDAAEIIAKKQPEVIFAELQQDQRSGLELLQLLRERLHPNQSYAFFLLTNKDSKALISEAAEESVDAIVVRPFTYEILKNQFLGVIKEKLAPTPYAQSLRQGRLLMEQNKMQEAVDAFRNARSQDSTPFRACALEGHALLKLERADEAIFCFQEALKINPQHFQSQLGLMDCFIKKGDNAKAYECARTVAEEHSVPLKRLPDMIRLSLVNKKYEDVVGFFKYADTLAQLGPAVSSHLSAGLVICGLYFLQKSDNAAAVDAFRKAEVSSQGNAKIQKRLLAALVRAGLDEEVKGMLPRLPNEVKDSLEVRVADLYRMAQKEVPSRTIDFGNQMLKQGIKDPEIYEILITKNLEVNRKASIVEDLVDNACRDFPEKAAFFRNLLTKQG